MMGPGASHPGSVTTIKAEEPRVKHKVSLLIDTGASISALPFSPGQVLQENYCSRHIRPASRTLFHSAFSLLLARFPFLSLLFNCPRNSYSSVRARPSIQIGVQLLLPPGEYFRLPLIDKQVDPMVWTDGHTVGWTQTAAPVLIHLKDPSWFPHQKQYPSKPEVKEG
jgi:hypothetical protein